MSCVHIIAEIGINHNGDLNLLMDMTREAISCGANSVKIQIRDIDRCYTKDELSTPCDSPWGNTIEDKVRGRELSWSEIVEFSDFCRELGIEWFASCFDLVSFQRYIESFGKNLLVRWAKVPSCLAVFPEYMDAVARSRLPTLISTGLLGSDREILKAIEPFEKHGTPYAVLHCVALYPCPDDRANILRVRSLQSLLMKSCGELFAVGYSGHERGILPSVLSVVQGATIVERHFTLDRTLYGADQAASLEPQGFCRLVRDIRSIEGMMGNGEHTLHGDEKRPVKSVFVP